MDDTWNWHSSLFQFPPADTGDDYGRALGWVDGSIKGFVAHILVLKGGRKGIGTLGAAGFGIWAGLLTFFVHSRF